MYTLKTFVFGLMSIRLVNKGILNFFITTDT